MILLRCEKPLRDGESDAGLLFLWLLKPLTTLRSWQKWKSYGQRFVCASAPSYSKWHTWKVIAIKRQDYHKSRNTSVTLKNAAVPLQTYNFWLVGSLLKDPLISFSNWQNKQAYGCNLYGGYKESRICKFNLNQSLNNLERLEFQSGKWWLSLACSSVRDVRELSRDKGASWVPSVVTRPRCPWDLHRGGTSSSFYRPFSSATVALLPWVPRLVGTDEVSPGEYQDFQAWPWNSGMQLNQQAHACGVPVNGGKISLGTKEKPFEISLVATAS